MNCNKALISGIIIACCALTITSCKRKDDVNIGGKGGNVTLHVMPQHHNDYIDSCTIYIRYNSKTAATAYDDSAKCMQVNNKSVATFSGLKKGDYYLEGKGWDPGIAEAVKGGTSVTITEEKEYDIFVAVTEDH